MTAGKVTLLSAGPGALDLLTLRAAQRLADAADGALTQQMQRFADRFLSARGWYECKNAHGDVTRGDLPSTTPYHLATAYAALPRAA